MTHTAAPDIPLVDLDAGATYGTEFLRLRRPFRLDGVEVREVPVKVPNGRDVLAHIDAASGKRDGVGLILALSGLTSKAWDALYAGDRGALDTLVGGLIGARQKPRPPFDEEIVDLDAKQGYGTEEVTLAQPFKHRGVTYRSITLRVPNGLDVSRFVDPLPTRNAVSLGLIGNLAELSADVFEVMIAVDLAEVQAVVGKHL